ncbi:MAG TPA: carbohydrate ABC transporter permease [Phototrophicaceae bacterium]|nr:carbohydrate ABC transporter permease [Phototrophicaceae bacterium]
MNTDLTRTRTVMPTSRWQMGLKTSTRIKKTLVTLVLIVLSLASLFPFYWMVSGSLKTEFETFQFPPTFYPHEPTLDNYVGLTHDLPFGLFYLNTIKIAGLSVIGELITSSLAGYAFARLEFPGKNKLFLFVLGTMMVPAIVTIIPLYILVYPLNWINTHYPLIIPSMLGSAYGTFLLRQYMLSLPKELEDAARIDGCNSFQVYYYIALPLMKPALATLGLFIFMAQWNDFFAPLIFLDKIDLYTVQLGANLAQGQWHTDQPRLMAGSVMITVPVLIIFIFLQRYFVRGINLTGIQG